MSFEIEKMNSRIIKSRGFIPISNFSNSSIPDPIINWDIRKSNGTSKVFWNDFKIKYLEKYSKNKKIC